MEKGKPVRRPPIKFTDDIIYEPEIKSNSLHASYEPPVIQPKENSINEIRETYSPQNNKTQIKFVKQLW